MAKFVSRVISLAAVILVIFVYNSTLSARAQSEEIARLSAELAAAETIAAASENENSYTDGTYTGTGEGFGGEIAVEVQIERGQITEIAVTSHDGEDGAYFSMAEQITEDMIAAQSAQVDLVSGATYSSTGIRDAVSEALSKAVTG